MSVPAMLYLFNWKPHCIMKEFVEIIKRIWFVVLILGFTLALIVMGMLS